MDITRLGALRRAWRDAGGIAGLLALLLMGAGARLASANACELEIDANDQMQFNARVLAVSAGCSEIKVTLRHVGKHGANVMGHDWVLARSSDVAALADAGMAAGLVSGYLPAGDRRVVAATRVIGGGEQASVTFPADRLVSGVEYSYFCSYPGHLAMMRGRFTIERVNVVARR